MTDYLKYLTVGKTILWCYLIWYLVTVYFHFDSSVSIWLSSAGLSVIIGACLNLSVSRRTGRVRDPWQTIRLFLIPFCVSSFSALIKGQGYILVIPPRLNEQLVSIGACVAFIAVVSLIKFTSRKTR